jgi:hypothetical protein
MLPTTMFMDEELEYKKNKPIISIPKTVRRVVCSKFFAGNNRHKKREKETPKITKLTIATIRDIESGTIKISNIVGISKGFEMLYISSFDFAIKYREDEILDNTSSSM